MTENERVDAATAAARAFCGATRLDIQPAEWVRWLAVVDAVAGVLDPLRLEKACQDAIRELADELPDAYDVAARVRRILAERDADAGAAQTRLPEEG